MREVRTINNQPRIRIRLEKMERLCLCDVLRQARWLLHKVVLVLRIQRWWQDMPGIYRLIVRSCKVERRYLIL